MKNKGFTLVELLAVIVIISLLSGLAIIGFKSFYSSAEDRYYNALESNILLAGNDYFEDHRGELPVGNDYSEVSLASLIDAKYMEPITDTNGNECREGSVFAYRVNNKIKYETCIVNCGGYSSTGRYCASVASREIVVSAKTKRENLNYDVTKSFNATEYTKNDNIIVTLNMSNDYSASRYVLTNTKNNNEIVCNQMDGNACSTEISTTGTYKIVAYDDDMEISSRYINAKIARNGSNFTLRTTDGRTRYLISNAACSTEAPTTKVIIDIVKGNAKEEYKTVEYKINDGEYEETNRLRIEKELPSGHYEIEVVVTNYNDNVSIETISFDVSYLINLSYDDNTTATHEVVKGKNYNYLSSLPETKSGKTIKWSKGNTIINPTSSIVDEDCTYTLTGSIFVPYTVTYDSNLGQMDVWGTSYKDRWTRTYDSATGLYNISCAGASGWELLYLPINTTANHLYRVTFDYQIPTAYTALSGYSGIGFQTVNSLVNSNMPSAIATAYLPTAVTAKTSQTFIFTATSSVTYFALNFGMAADGVTTTIKFGNVKVYDDTSGTSVFAASPASESKISGTQYGTLASVERTGYTFNGWYTSPSGGTKIETTTTNNATSNQTLYAHWTMGTYTQIYRPNGGSGSNSASETIGYWEIWTSKPTSTYTKTGYTFNCWQSSTSSSCYGGNGWFYASADVGSSRYLDATWTANALTFNDQSISKTFSTSAQTFSVTGASNGTGTYTYSIKSQPSGSYFTISGTTVTMKASTPAGTYSVVITAKDSNSNATKDATYTVTVGKATGYINISTTTGSIGYGTTSATCFSISSSHGGTLSVSDNNSTASCSVSGTTVSCSSLGSLAAGTTVTVTAKSAATNNYTEATKTYTLTVNKVNATCPTISDWTGTYDGSQHSINVSGGSGGSIQYRWNSTTEAWRDTKPTASVAGTWNVYVQMKGDSNHNTVSCGYKTLTINKANPSFAKTESSKSIYNGRSETYGLVPSIAGKITSSSNATGVATVSQASNCSSIGAGAQCVITITGKSVGSATITHTFTPNDSNYNSVTTTMPVTIKNNAFTVTFAGVNPIGTSFDNQTVTLAGNVGVPAYASSTLALATNTNYVVSFDYKCASGSNQFDVDFFPDTLPQTNPTATTTLQHMDWITSSSNSAMGSAQLRFFDDFQGSGETDITITNIMLSRTSTKTVYYGSTYGDLPAPTRSGYTFNGWYTASNGGTQITSSSTVSTAANHTLYARWSKTTCCPSGGWYNGGYCYNTPHDMTDRECSGHGYYMISGRCYEKRSGAHC